jgi:chromosome segregation ATPase
MADVTWGVKVPEEIKEKIQNMMQDSQLSGKEFIESLLQAYALNKLKENQPLVAPDIDELQILINRIVSIYANLGERISNMIQEKDNLHENEVAEKINIIGLLGDKVDNLEKEKEKALDDKQLAETMAADMQKRIVEIEETVQTNKALVVEYKEKNDALNSIAAEYQQYKANFENLRSENQELHYNLKNTKTELENAQNTTESLKKKYDAEIKEKNEKHNEDLSRLTERMEIEKSKELFKLRNEYQSELESAHEKTVNLHDEYNSKIKVLLDQIGELQNTMVKSKTNKTE